MANWDERYAEAIRSGRRLFPAHASLGVVAALDMLEKLSPAPAGAPTAIDVGAGEGRHARELTGRGYVVTALEGSAVAVEAALGRPEPGISWVAGDAGHWRPAAAVDLVLAAYLHSPDFHVSSVLGNMTTWLRPGGQLVLVGHAVRNLTRDVPGPKNPAMLWEPTQLAGELARLGYRIDFAGHIDRVKVRPKRSRARQDVSSDAVVLATLR
ncbi:class I SAM-dependent methyltransferase [Buchananella felis]|uniref:class I SAM-dependent methyltransferase n=1 Tax=Buchananella felis TaxID=3231492 RepID=UPI003529C7FB